jgi:hypothetical protein
MQHPRNRSIARSLLALALAASAGSLPAASHAETHELFTRVDGARVQMQIPASPHVGGTTDLEIRVIPEPGATPPAQVRTRLGMPDHGHWITEEAVSRDVANPVHHRADLPMGGVYRLRVWLDYPDGRVLRTGADFDVDHGRTGAPRPAP